MWKRNNSLCIIFLFLVIFWSTNTVANDNQERIEQLKNEITALEKKIEIWDEIRDESFQRVVLAERNNKITWFGSAAFKVNYYDLLYPNRAFWVLRNPTWIPEGNHLKILNQVTLRGSYAPRPGSYYVSAIYLSALHGSNGGEKRLYLQPNARDVRFRLNHASELFGTVDVSLGLLRPEYSFGTVSGFKSAPLELPWYDYSYKGSVYDGQEIFGIEVNFTKPQNTKFLWGRKYNHEDLYYLKIKQQFSKGLTRGEYGLNYQLIDGTTSKYKNEIFGGNFIIRPTYTNEFTGEMYVSTWNKNRETKSPLVLGTACNLNMRLIGRGELIFGQSIFNMKYQRISPNYVSLRSKIVGTNFYGNTGITGVSGINAYPAAFSFFNQYTNNREGLSFNLKTGLGNLNNILSALSFDLGFELLQELKPTYVYQPTSSNYSQVPIATNRQTFSNYYLEVRYGVNELIKLPWKTMVLFGDMGSKIERGGGNIDDPLNRYGNNMASQELSLSIDIPFMGLKVEARQWNLEYKHFKGNYVGRNISLIQPEKNYYSMGNNIDFWDIYYANYLHLTYNFKPRASMYLKLYNVDGRSNETGNELNITENRVEAGLSKSF